jgi:hypothetical protein
MSVSVSVSVSAFISIRLHFVVLIRLYCVVLIRLYCVALIHLALYWSHLFEFVKIATKRQIYLNDKSVDKLGCKIYE